MTAAAIHAANPPPEPPPSPDVVRMQQFIVEATRIDAHPWTLLEGPGFEILSRCDTRVTQMTAIGILNDLPLQKELVPPAYWAQLPTPITYILFNRKPQEMAASPLIPDPVRRGGDDDFNWGNSALRGRYLTGSVSASDADKLINAQNEWGVDRLVERGAEDYGRLQAVALPTRLYQCVPVLPLWYQAGIAGPYGIYHVQPQPKGMILAAALWISKADTDAMLSVAKKAKTLPTLPPVADLFSEHRPDGLDSSPMWLAEAGLFVRWGLFEQTKNEPSHRRAFALLVERSRAEPVTEALFQECFGFGYAELQSRLSRYFAEAVKEPIGLRYQSLAEWPPERPSLVPRNATPAEIARILGDWERIEGDTYKPTSLAISDLYLNQAGKTLHESYAKGERDPQLLAVLGLYDYDTGNVAEARGFLETATQAAVQRPTAYFDLAQLNFSDAQAHPTAGDKLSVQQTAAVLNPLFAAARQAPLKAAGYTLMADVWAHCVARPLPTHLAALRTGLKLYPRDAALTYAIARVHGQWDYKPEAEAIIDSGLKFADERTAQQFLALRSWLQTGK